VIIAPVKQELFEFPGGFVALQYEKQKFLLTQ